MVLQQFIIGLCIGAVYALIAVGFALVYNILKFSNLAHGGIMVVAAYVGYTFAADFGLSFAVSIVLAALFSGVLMTLVEKVAYYRVRKKGIQTIYFFIGSITFSILLQNIVIIVKGNSFYRFPSETVPSNLLNIFGVSVSVLEILILSVSIAMLIIITIILKKTRVGLAIRAASMDLKTCSLMGVNVDTVITTTFFIAGILGGISGVFLSIRYTLTPGIALLIVKGFIASIIGGLGSLGGAVVGAIMLGLVEVLFTSLIGAGLTPVLVFVIAVIFLTIRPCGIAGNITEEKA